MPTPPRADGLRPRHLAGAVVGPAVFIASWAVLGARRDGYSAIEDPISRLAALGSPTRAEMTAGFLVYAAAIATYVRPARTELSGPAATAIAVNALAAVAVAATPLESSLGGAPHAVAAGITYASLSAVPLLAAQALASDGRSRLAWASRFVGVAGGACLALSAADVGATGLFQRSGLTLGHTWLAASAVALLRRDWKRAFPVR